VTENACGKKQARCGFHLQVEGRGTADELPPDRLRQGYGESAEALRAKAEGGSHKKLGGHILAALLALGIICAPPHSAKTAEPLFVEAAEASGLTFTHVNGATGQYYMAEEMGAGVALFDYDNDGDLDVFLVQGGELGTGKSAKTAIMSRLFRNDLTTAGDKRALHFTDVTDQAGIRWQAYGMGVAVGDYDNDGDLDLFLTSFGPDALFRNNGNGTFTEVTEAAGVSDPLWSTSATFFDYDRDGDLDLFVANYLDFTLTDNKACADSVGARDYCSPRSYHPVPDRLYRNDGNGHFTNITESSGTARADGAGLGVTAGDYNGDGWLDLYVANDATPNQLWINRHDGTFEDQGMIAGVAVNAAGNPEGSMGIASGDVDADGDEDLFVTNIIGETFALYENDGQGMFDDARVRWGVATPTAASTGFGTDWIDYDNDGWLDLFIANGAVNVMESLRGQPNPFRMKRQLFHNTGKRRLLESSPEGGPAFEQAEVGRGAAFGDIDNDGDTDIVVTNNDGPVRLLLNQARRQNHWLQVRLEQAPGNRLGMGAWIAVERPGLPALCRRVKTDGSYLSASDIRAHFGLGSSAAIGAIDVQWPDGVRERWTDVKGDRLVTLKRGAGR
jgi:enediyne biosynthesis protein E4